MNNMIPARFDNIFEKRLKKKKLLYTKSLYSDFVGFEERVISDKGVKYREVDPMRSKLFAGIVLGISQIGIREGSNVLYLGASHGYTPSFVSDIIGETGKILCVDIAPRVVRDLCLLCEKRPNMAPLLANSRHPEFYKQFVPEKVDIVFQDIAQRDQVDIFLSNARMFLKNKGFAIIALKARSIDVSKKPTVIFKKVFRELNSIKDFVIVDKRELAPLEKDHMLFVLKKVN